jgi:hypothetical protein
MKQSAIAAVFAGLVALLCAVAPASANPGSGLAPLKPLALVAGPGGLAEKVHLRRYRHCHRRRVRQCRRVFVRGGRSFIRCRRVWRTYCHGRRRGGYRGSHSG